MLDAIKCKDTYLNVAIAMVKGDKGPTGKMNKIEDAATGSWFWVKSTLGEKISSDSVLTYSCIFSSLWIFATGSVRLSRLAGKLLLDL